MATATEIVNIALAEEGVAESPLSSNNVKYNTAFYGHQVHDPDSNGNYIYPWCVVFVWWVFRKAGASSLFCGGAHVDSAKGVYDYYKQAGRVYSSPKKGDIMVRKKGSSYTHAGIVYSATSATNFKTIDGNVSDKVCRNSRSSESGVTYYFCRPAYGGTPTATGSTLSIGSSGAEVLDMQKKLIKLGYSCVSACSDGQFCHGTYNAVCSFQRDHSLTVDGIIGPATKAAINSAYSGTPSSSNVLSMGSSGSDVRNMQTKLIKLGYSCGSAGADGQFGQGTYNAVCSFQRNNGLTVDGIIGPATRSKINTLYKKKFG